MPGAPGARGRRPDTRVAGTSDRSPGVTQGYELAPRRELHRADSKKKSEKRKEKRAAPGSCVVNRSGCQSRSRDPGTGVHRTRQRGEAPGAPTHMRERHDRYLTRTCACQADCRNSPAVDERNGSVGKGEDPSTMSPAGTPPVVIRSLAKRHIVCATPRWIEAWLGGFEIGVSATRSVA